MTLQRSGRPGGGGDSRASGPRPIHRIGPAVLAHMRAQAGASSAGNSEAKRSSLRSEAEQWSSGVPVEKTMAMFSPAHKV